MRMARAGRRGTASPREGVGGTLNLQRRCWGRLMRCVQNGRQVPEGHADSPPSPVGPSRAWTQEKRKHVPTDPVPALADAPLPTATTWKPQHARPWRDGHTVCSAHRTESHSTRPAPGRMQPPAQGQGPRAQGWGTELGTCSQGDAQDGQTRGDRGHRWSPRAAGKREGVASGYEGFCWRQVGMKVS